MWEKDDNMAARIPDTEKWERWIMQLSEGLREMLRLPAASVLAGLDGAGISAAFHPVPVSGFLTERIASGGGDMVLPLMEGRSGWEEERYAVSSLRQGNVRRRGSRTPYETSRELQKQSELLLRT